MCRLMHNCLVLFPVLWQNVSGTYSNAKEIALWKAQYASFNILMDELKLMELAIEQCADIKVEENASVDFLLKNVSGNLEENECIDGRKMHINKHNCNQDVRDSLQIQW